MDKLEKVFYYNGLSDIGALNVEIHVSMNQRNLSEKDKKIILDTGMKLVDALYMESVNTDPTRIEEKKKFREELQNAFELVGLAPIYMEEIPNEYNSRYSFIEPWYSITTRLGRFKVGWRKRVIHLEWLSSAILQTADELFKDDSHVTMGGRMIHCWGMGKLQEYLQVLAKAGKGT